MPTAEHTAGTPGQEVTPAPPPRLPLLGAQLPSLTDRGGQAAAGDYRCCAADSAPPDRCRQGWKQCSGGSAWVSHTTTAAAPSLPREGSQLVGSSKITEAVCQKQGSNGDTPDGLKCCCIVASAALQPTPDAHMPWPTAAALPVQCRQLRQGFRTQRWRRGSGGRRRWRWRSWQLCC